MTNSYTLFELNEYIKRVIALNFAEPIWINCEISQSKNSRGNIYLDLVQQNENDEVVAQSSAALWYKNFLFLRTKLGELLPALLQPGVHVKIKVTVEYNERYGMKLIVEDIDPSYTIGKQEMARQKIMERLRLEEVTELNKALPLPTVIQRIAVISADNAAGFIDFRTHLEKNSYGYHFRIDLYQAAMQGTNTESEVCLAIDTILEKANQYDIITIIRGGGSKLDLAAFDNFNIGYKIATCPLPVITGIGHEIDQSIADLMAHMAMKTPTAVADYIVEQALVFESNVIEMMLTVERTSQQLLKQHHLQLENTQLQLNSLPREKMRAQLQSLVQMQETIVQYCGFHFQKHHTALLNFDQILKVSDPVHTLNKGFALIKQDGHIVSKKSELKSSTLSIVFADGTIDGSIEY